MAGAAAGVDVAAAVAGALGDQAAAIASEKTVTTPRIASTTKPPATSALVLSTVVLCSPSGWSAIRGRVYRQSHRRGDNMRLSTRASTRTTAWRRRCVGGGWRWRRCGCRALRRRRPRPKYFFQLREVKAGPDIDPALKEYAGEALKADLAARPEWASDVQAASPEAARWPSSTSANCADST